MTNEIDMWIPVVIYAEESEGGNDLGNGFVNRVFGQA